MITYLIVGLISLTLSYLTKYKNFKYGLLGSFICIFFFLALRYNYGNDYPGYFIMFNNINKHISADNIDDMEFGWIILNKLFGPFGFFSMIFCLSILNCIVYYKFIKRYVNKKYYWFAIFIYYFNPYFFLIQLSAMRQCIAIILFILSIDYTLSKKYIKSIVLILLAFIFHTSAILLIPIILISLLIRFKIKILHIIVIESLFISLSFFGNWYKSLYLDITTTLPGFKYLYYQYQDLTEMNLTNGLIYSTLLFIILQYYNKFTFNFQLITKFFVFGLLLLPIGFIIPLSSRMALYLLPLSIVIYPKLLELTKSTLLKQVFIISVIAIILVRLYTFFIANPPYLKYLTIINTL